MCRQWKHLLEGPSQAWQKIEFRAGKDDEYPEVCCVQRALRASQATAAGFYLQKAVQ